MAVAKWCVLNALNQVVNVVLWDSVANPGWLPPAGTTVVAYDAALPIAPLPVETLNERTVRAAIVNALQANRNYRAIVGPTVAQQQAQLDAVTAQLIAIERAILGQFDGTN